MPLRSVDCVFSLSGVSCRTEVIGVDQQKTGALIRRLRLEKGLTQRALAEAVGVGAVSYTHLDVYKRQRSSLYPHYILRMKQVNINFTF